MGKTLIVLGIVLVVAGAILTWGPKLSLGPFGKLPGDIRIERPGFRFYFPVTTSILVSIAITILLRFLGKK